MKFITAIVFLVVVAVASAQTWVFRQPTFAVKGPALIETPAVNGFRYFDYANKAAVKDDFYPKFYTTDDDFKTKIVGDVEVF